MLQLGMQVGVLLLEGSQAGGQLLLLLLQGCQLLHVVCLLTQAQLLCLNHCTTANQTCTHRQVELFAACAPNGCNSTVVCHCTTFSLQACHLTGDPIGANTELYVMLSQRYTHVIPGQWHSGPRLHGVQQPPSALPHPPRLPAA